MRPGLRRAGQWLLAAALALPVLAAGALLAESFRYPRIARSGYWRHPGLLIRATVTRCFPGTGVASSAVLEQAARLGLEGPLEARLLVLPLDEVGERYGDKSIRDRVFGMATKGWASSREEIYWAVAKQGRLLQLDDDWLAFEYRTGQLVCGVHRPALLGPER